MSTLQTIKIINNDIEIINGKTTIIYDAEAFAQIIQGKLKLWLGEWFGNVTAGIDYLGLFNQKTFLDKRFALIIRNILLADKRITKINSLTTNFDRTTRTISANFQVTSIYGIISGAV